MNWRGRGIARARVGDGARIIEEVIRAVAQAGTGALALFAATLACGHAEYLCISDVECGEGQCTAAGYCGFLDDTCASGLRYGDQADAALAGTCVPAGEGSGQTTGGPVGDTSTDGGSGETVAVDDGTTEGGSTADDDDDSSSSGVTHDCQTWWDPAYVSRRALVVQAPANGETIEGFPAMVSLAQVGLAAPTGDDLLDVRVLTEDCEPVPHEIEPDLDDSPGAIWFRAPSVGPEPTAMWLYYGNSSALDASDPAGVWDERFVGVWHFAEVADSTANGHTLDPGRIALFADGPIAQASVFDGVDDRWSLDPMPTLTDLPEAGMTVSAWIRSESEMGLVEQRILDKKTSASLSGFRLSVRQSMRSLELEAERGHDADPARWRSLGAPLQTGEWAHIAMTLDDADPGPPELYVGGLPQAVSTLMPGIGMPLSDVNVPMSVGGSAYDGTVFFDGRIDELRISSQVRSPDWLRAEYLSMTGGLVTVGEAESSPGG